MAAHSFRFLVMNTDILVAKILLKIPIQHLLWKVLACIFEVLVHMFVELDSDLCIYSNVQLFWVSLYWKVLNFTLKVSYKGYLGSHIHPDHVIVSTALAFFKQNKVPLRFHDFETD